MLLSVWPSAVQPYDEILEVTRHAAATGWHTAYVADHFMPNAGPGATGTEPVLECGSLAAALGAAVPGIRIGTLVYGNTYRHPALLANMAATVDRITGGRFTLGVGAGWQANEHEQYGIELPPVKQRLDRFVEALHVLKGLLRTPATTFSGTHYRLTGAVCEPKPVQEPLPLLIGGKGERRMLRIVAEHADMWNSWCKADLFTHRSKVLDDHCAAVGRDPSTIKRSAQALVGLDGPLPETSFPTVGGSHDEVRRAFDDYREAGLDELIVPDWLLGRGAARLHALDTIRELAGS